jgi:hypothetical protein
MENKANNYKRVTFNRDPNSFSTKSYTRMANSLNGIFNAFILASIADIQKEMSFNEEKLMFESDYTNSKGRKWKTFSQCSSSNVKDVIYPVSLSTESKSAIMGLLLATTDLINNTEENCETLEDLVRANKNEYVEANICDFICKLVKTNPWYINKGNLTTEIDSVNIITELIKALINDSDTSIDFIISIARTFVRLLKIISYQVAVIACERGHIVLNRGYMSSVIAQLLIALPNDYNRKILRYIKTNMSIRKPAIVKTVKTPAATITAITSTTTTTSTTTAITTSTSIPDQSNVDMNCDDKDTEEDEDAGEDDNSDDEFSEINRAEELKSISLLIEANKKADIELKEEIKEMKEKVKEVITEIPIIDDQPNDMLDMDMGDMIELYIDDQIIDY